MDRDEEARNTIAVLQQALQMAQPLVPEYTGKGEFARDDITAALEVAEAYWRDFPQKLVATHSRVAVQVTTKKRVVD